MKWRRKTVAWMLLLVIVAAGVWGYQLHFKPKRVVALLRAELIAAGEKLALNEVTPPRTLRSANSVDLFRNISQLYNTRGNRTLLDTNFHPSVFMVSPGKSAAAWRLGQIMDFSGKKPATNSWEELEAALEASQGAFKELAGMIDQPTLDFGLDYSAGFNLLLPHLAQQKWAAVRLDVLTSLELHKGHPPQAMRHLRTQLALAHATRDEPLVISQLVRIAIAALAFNTSWAVLQSPDVTESELASLQGDWERLNFVTTMRQALEMDRAMVLMTLERMRSDANQLRSMSPAGVPGPLNFQGDDLADRVGNLAKSGLQIATVNAAESAWRFSWSHEDELRSLRASRLFLSGFRKIESGGKFDEVMSETKLGLEAVGINLDGERDDTIPSTFMGSWKRMFSDSSESLYRTLQKIRSAEVTRQVAISAIAIRRYQLRHGALPEALAALVPDFISAIPADPVDSKPLRYRLDATSRGFVLYSIGEDGEDNGGDCTQVAGRSSLNWRNGKDWLWPQVASAEEIAGYFERSGKVK
jgi:hypothetical protein